MAAMDFPNSPTDGQLYTPTNGATYQWSASGSRWILKPIGQQFLPLSGGTMTGDIVLAADANAALEATTKQQMDAADTASAQATMSAEDNLLVNGGFDIAQRGTSFPVSGGASVKTLDRWTVYGAAGNTLAVFQATQAVGTVGAGDHVVNLIGVQRTVTGSADPQLYQAIENVRTAEGQTITVSFLVNSTVSGTLGCSVAQYFGTGGAPSASVLVNQTFTVAAASTYERKILTFSVPSISGKTLGTNNDHSLQLMFFISTARGNGTFYFGNIDLRLGTIAPAQFLRRPVQEELALCQRYYQTLSSLIHSGYSTAGAAFWIDRPFQTAMRATPTTTFNSITYNNASALGAGTVTPTHANIQLTITATGYGSVQYGMTMDAEL